MLREIRHVSRKPGEPRRRWFSDAHMDLTVWYAPDGSIVGFQICYDKQTEERAITWWADKGYLHDRVDDGEDRPGTHKSAPILIRNWEAKAHEGTLREFQERSSALDPALVALVSERLGALSPQ